MAIYRYQHQSLVDSVQILTNDTKGLRAYLYADDARDTEKLRLLKQALRAEGYKCVPTLQNENVVLEVRGFKNHRELIGNLEKLHAVSGPVEVVSEPGDKLSRKDQLASNTLKLAGISYNVGDVSYIIYATKQFLDEKKLHGSANMNFFNRLNIAAGIGYALGSTALTIYGSRDQSLNAINTANKKIYAHFRKEHIDVPQGSTLKSAMQDKDRGFFGNIDHMLAKYPSETLNSVYVGVGLALMSVAGYKATRPIEKGLSAAAHAAEKAERITEAWDVGLGSVTATSALIGLTVKEKKHIEGEPRRKGLGAVLDFIEEKPLRATGIGYGIATGFHAVSTFKKFRAGDTNIRKTVFFRGVFVAANVLSEALLFLSSKGHGVGVKPDASVDQSVIAATAELMMRQPAEKRDAMIENLAGYMSSRDVLGIDAAVISTEMRKHIDALQRSPWTKHYIPNHKGEMVEAAPEQVQEMLRQNSAQQPSTSIGPEKQLQSVVEPAAAAALPVHA